MTKNGACRPLAAKTTRRPDSLLDGPQGRRREPRLAKRSGPQTSRSPAPNWSTGLEVATCSDRLTLVELIKVLAPHPGGLRRWSVMRGIRKDRESAVRDIPQKFEDEVERTFRRFCADAGDAKAGTCAAKDAFFYRPKERAGEVWAIFPDRAKAWLDAEPVESSNPA